MQAEVLVKTLCPDAKDPALCEAVIGTHWSLLGLTIYPQFFDAGPLCKELGVCFNARGGDLVKEWTCEMCVGGIQGLARIVMNIIPDIVDFLKVVSIMSFKVLFHEIAWAFCAQMEAKPTSAAGILKSFQMLL